MELTQNIRLDLMMMKRVMMMKEGMDLMVLLMVLMMIMTMD